VPDDLARRRLKQKVLERWENEGGKIIDPNKARTAKTLNVSKGKQSTRSRKNSSVSPSETLKSERKPR